MLAILGIAVIFNSLVLVTTAVMQAHGDVKTPVINLIIGGIVKIIVNYILVGTRTFNIIGAPIGTVCCYAVITALNFLALRRITTLPSFRRTLLKPIVASALMGAAAYGAYAVISRVIGSQKLCCLGAICAAGLVYLALVIVMKIITLDDCALLPKGDKIAKLLRIEK